MFSRKGFTLIELVMVIVILAILAAVAIPQYFNLKGEALNAAEKGVVGGVRSGIFTYFANYKTFPAELDNTADGGVCNSTNPCFENVLSQGAVTSDWTKNAGNKYTGPALNNYTYNSSTGNFN